MSTDPNYLDGNQYISIFSKWFIETLLSESQNKISFSFCNECFQATMPVASDQTCAIAAPG